MNAVQRFVALALIILFVAASRAAAQGASGKWEIEVHGGPMLATSPTDGTSSLPAAGAPFTTVVGQPSRCESSWYFGDGPVLLNQLGTALRSTGQITSLDAVLTKSVVHRENGPSFGFRISRHINPRYTAELVFDYNRGRLAIDSAGLAGIEASRASFTSAINGLLATGPFNVATVTSTATIQNNEGHQMFTTGVLNINLMTKGRVIPYASVGGGLVVNGGDTPSATLAGNYRFSIVNIIPVNESDTVTLRYAVKDHAFVAVLGGGVKYFASPRWGVRVDVRAHVGKNSIDNLVDANAVTATQMPAGAIASFTNPSAQFTNNPPSGARSTLGGPAMTGFRTFAGGGTQSQISIVPGFFWRF